VLISCVRSCISLCLCVPRRGVAWRGVAWRGAVPYIVLYRKEYVTDAKSVNRSLDEADIAKVDEWDQKWDALSVRRTRLLTVRCAVPRPVYACVALTPAPVCVGFESARPTPGFGGGCATRFAARRTR
jgi:hypothetical protein